MNGSTIAAIFFAAIVAALALVYWLRSDKIYAVDGAATKVEVLRGIPIGSKVEFARATMEAKGFTCTMEYNKPYGGDDPVGGSQMYPAADFLYCDSERWAGSIFASKRWQVILVVEIGR